MPCAASFIKKSCKVVYFKKKYKKEIDVLLNDMAEQAKKEAIESNKRIDEYIQSNKNNEYTCIPPKDANELPFS